RKKAEHPRAVTVQKCMRAGGKHNDLENVGRTGRHHTFFEMLGNFSFGDYFKEEAIKYCWDWVTEWIKLPGDRLYATVYEEDDEAFALWEKIAPELKNGRILRFDKKENYWSMGDVGPCGPCSEMHFDRGERFGTGPEAVVNGESERFVEIWNLVFMQFDQKPDGTVVPLPKPSVDTGAGLERIACVMQDAESNYETDLFTRIIDTVSELSGKRYYTDGRGVSHRVIADHVRALTFCIADGGGLSNEKQGYVLRRILRRAARHGRLLEIDGPFIYKLVPTLVDLMGDVYPEIKDRREHIENVIRIEEESFGRTLDGGLQLFDGIVGKLEESGKKQIPGEDIFRLYDTYGFPVDLTRVMAEERDLTIDMPGFDQAMVRHQELSRTGVGFQDNRVQEHARFIDALKEQGFDQPTEFHRHNLSLTARVVSVSAMPLPDVALVLDRTTFYVEAGGQVSDKGRIVVNGHIIIVDEVFNHQGVIIHAGRFESELGASKAFEKLRPGAEVQVTIDSGYRWDIMRNHTATHLLHASLRTVLGEHVYQSGSYVGPDKLRFDFSHFKPMAPEEITEVERMVNEKILEGEDVHIAEDSLENARKSGAMAIFGEKYESKVRVVSIGDFSKELCGGTHVQNISQIGPFLITLETGIASGIRRIEAITGRKALKMMLSHKHLLEQIEDHLNRPVDELVDAVRENSRKLLELQKEIKKLKAERFTGNAVSVGQEKKIGPITLRFHDFGEVEPDEMSGWVDSVKGVSYPMVCIALGAINGKKTCMSAASSTVKAHIGNLSQEVLQNLGGQGGGRPNFARGSVPSEVDSEAVFSAFEEKLKEYVA
ncbi:MAG: alanine--tRNA ligase, partial [Candidatus Zixiibacteriota bacterium]